MLSFLSLFFFLAGPAYAAHAAASPAPLLESEQLNAEERGVSEKKVPSPWSLHAQSTMVSQEHGGMRSPYEGPNSLSGAPDARSSFTATGFLGRTLWKNAETYFDPEASAGSGFSGTHGLAGFSNGEAYRVSTPKPRANLARLYLKQVIALSDDTEFEEDDLNSLAAFSAKTRLTFVLGKFSLNDFFDTNSYAHDPRTQFLNWSLWENGAWDYAADSRGYTWGFYAEWNHPSWALRLALALEPTVANLDQFDTHVSKANGTNLEFEQRFTLAEHPGRARLLGYLNHAHMGNYEEAIGSPTPNGVDITSTRSYSKKYGGGINLEQEVARDVGLFFRLGADDGQTESWTFSEIDRTASLGLNLGGARWNRSGDVFGLAGVINGLSTEHRNYLAAGGEGFLLGDGALNYGPEKILEIFYLAKLFQHFGITADFQYATNPGYNRDRGPAAISALRLHYEI